MPDSPPETNRLDSLTGLRFFAALFVLLYHTRNLLEPRLVGWNLWSYGGLGVPFFFALSGFVLTWTARSGDSAPAFWRRRAARVLPLYFAMFVISYVLVRILTIPAPHFVSAGTSSEQDLLPWINLTMLQGWVGPFSQLFLVPGPASPNPPGWSLSDEVFFYALFPLVIPLLGRMGPNRIATLLLGVGAFLVLFYLASGNQVWVSSFPPFEIGFFVAGMATARAVRRGVWFPPLPLVLVGMAALAVGLYEASRQLLGIAQNFTLVEIIVLPAILVLIGSAARADLSARWSPLRHRVIVTLGVWSFALYLVQMVCIMTANAVMPGGDFSTDRLTGTGEAVVFVVFVVLVAAVAHKLIEAPANARLRHAPPSIISEQEHEATPA